MNAIVNGIGVDYQPSHCVVALREGTGIPPRTRSVGDGIRQIVANPAELFSDGAPNADFWRRIADRLYIFLGRVRPVSDNGYEVVIATARDPEGIARTAHTVGLTDVTGILPADALVARWLIETAGRQTDRGLIVAVTVGEIVTTVSSYAVTLDGRGLPRVERGRGQVVGAGYQTWLPIFFDRVRQRLVEETDVAHDATLFDSAVEFGAKLRTTPAGKNVEWHGPWPDRLYDPLRVTREECEAWDPVRNWMNRVGGMVGDIALGSGGSSISRILIGGIGAVWPFAADAVARWGKVWQSGAPWLDLAAGAAWWEEARSCFTGEARPSRVEIPIEPVLALGPGASAETSPLAVTEPLVITSPAARPKEGPASPFGDLVLDEISLGELGLEDPKLGGLPPAHLDLPRAGSGRTSQENPKAPDTPPRRHEDDSFDLPPLEDLPPWERHGDPNS